MRHPSYNTLTATVTRKGVIVPEEKLTRAHGFQIRKAYPGGLFMSLTFSIPLRATEKLLIHGGDELVVKNGNKIVFEGFIDNIIPNGYQQNGSAQIEVIGYWLARFTRRGINKRWVDDRLGAHVWAWDETASGAELAGFDRDNRLRFTPKHEAWNTGVLARAIYTMPYGQTIKRVVLNYDVSELASESTKKVLHYDSAGPTFTSLANLCDGDPSTNHAITVTTGDYLYVDMLEDTSYNALYIDVGATPNANVSVMTAEYPSVDTAGNVTWNALTITDGTISAGKTLAIDGTVSFTRPGDLAKTSVNGESRAWIRLLFSANLTTSMILRDVYVREQQAWELRLYDPVGAANIWSVTATGTGSRDDTLGTPRRTLYLEFLTRGKQTPPNNGTIYGQIDGVKVYSETGNINAYEVANDIRADLSLSVDTTWLSSGMTTDLNPNFVTTDYEYYAALMQRAANFGDTSGNAIGYGLYPSDITSDGAPALFLETRPNPYTSTSYDYMTTTHLAKVPTFREDYGSIRNWIVVKYTDLKGLPCTLDPNEQSTLTDSESVATYGTRMLVVDAGSTDATGALAYGVRALAHYKDPIISVTGPIVCLDYVLNPRGIPVPASEVQPGKIINVLDYNGLRGLITETNYNDADKTVSLTLGSSDDFTNQLAQTKNNAPLHF